MFYIGIVPQCPSDLYPTKKYWTRGSQYTLLAQMFVSCHLINIALTLQC